ncbi:MAG TPA: DUF4147 domain-containing protein [Gammaproteobacteria bacterium]|nr:DUF4147 domain-containing protein [Gammaproteobacteria bacterium]
MEDPVRLLIDLFRTAITAVDGRRSVAAALQASGGERTVEVIGLGKAAVGMSRGAVDVLGGRIRRGLVVTASGCNDISDRRFECYEAGHPVPDARSFAAGQRLLDFLHESPPDVRFLFLISGGASALVDVPAPGIAPEELVELNRWLLGSGFDIGAMNAVRKSVSRIKGGGLLRYIGNRPAKALYISDVTGDRVADIGSGPLGPIEHRPLPPLPERISVLIDKARSAPPADNQAQVERKIVATLADAMDGAAAEARRRGFDVFIHEVRLAGEADEAGAAIAEKLLQAPPGIHIWGGETVVRLPPNPGRGGRSQQLALAAAVRLNGCDGISLLAAGTDGVDGTGDAAGAIVGGGTVARGIETGADPAAALARADAGAFLEAAGSLLRTGATGTNVTDIVLGLKTEAEKVRRVPEI